MRVVILDSNAIIMHGRSFPERVRSAVEAGMTLVVAQSVKRELVDDVLENESASPNHRSSAQAIQELIDNGYLVLRKPDFDTYGGVVDEARRRIADPSLPEHELKADQYIPAIVIEAAQDNTVALVTADRKLRSTVRDIADREGVGDNVYLRDPLSVL
jgi:rRNA-processing protein FCF1